MYIAGRVIWGLGVSIGLAIAAPELNFTNWQWLIAVGVIAVLTTIGDRVSGHI